MYYLKPISNNNKKNSFLKSIKSKNWISLVLKTRMKKISRKKIITENFEE